ncbi:hypothetical protein GCM10017752_45390 [Streptomyces roseoviridis]
MAEGGPEGAACGDRSDRRELCAESHGTRLGRAGRPALAGTALMGRGGKRGAQARTPAWGINRSPARAASPRWSGRGGARVKGGPASLSDTPHGDGGGARAGTPRERGRDPGGRDAARAGAGPEAGAGASGGVAGGRWSGHHPAAQTGAGYTSCPRRRRATVEVQREGAAQPVGQECREYIRRNQVQDRHRAPGRGRR